MVSNLQQEFEVMYFGLDIGPQSFCRSFVALSMVCRSKSAHTFAVSSVLSRNCCYGNHTVGFKPI